MDVRIPPHNLDAEKAVLGALLTNGSNMGAVVDTVTSILKSEDFYRDAHRIIYDAILEIVHANKTADFITVGEELDRRKRLDAVGGLAYITSLANESVSYNVEEHAKIISEKAQLRRLIDAGNKIVGMTYAGEDEPTAILNKAEQMVLDVSGQTQSESSFAAIGEVVLSNLDKLNALQQHDGAITGVPTGFKDVDHIFNGLQKSDLILVAARPAMGKTAFTLNIAQNVTMLYDKTVAFFSLEMGKEQLVGRILSSVAGVSSEKLRRANMDPADWEKVIAAADRMSKSKLFIDDTPGLTVQDMRSKLRRLKVEHGLDLVIVDYIQLMQGRNAGKGSENRQQEVSEISRNLKLIAREFNVPVIALSQLSRSVESRPDKRPVLSDL
ncbi:MAG: replicative DNA helicase, partial [Veillonella sp.]|nr:replicative DNA helicase [Veillonella sp.]